MKKKKTLIICIVLIAVIGFILYIFLRNTDDVLPIEIGSFKEEKYKESEKYFGRILKLKQINNARKTEAAFWAGRAADLNDDRADAKKYWRIAAAHPMAFYGALAATMLGDVPEYEFFEQEFTDDDVEELRRDKYGKIALALLQVNRKERAEEYLKYNDAEGEINLIYMIKNRPSKEAIIKFRFRRF